MSYSIHDIDWIKYLDRKQPLFLFAAFIRPYGELAEKVTGFRYHHQLQTFSGDTGTFYKSAKEMEAAEAYFLDLAVRKDPRLEVWRDRGVELNVKAESFIQEFSTNPPPIGRESFWPLYEICEQVMLYDTTIPFRILVAINSAIESNGGECPENLKYALDLFEPFRAGATYPKLVEHVFPHFWKAAAKCLSIEDSELLSCTTPLELKAIIEGEMSVEPSVLEKRKKWCAFWEDSTTGVVEFEYNQETLKDLPLFGTYSEQKEVTGTVAYKGIVRGRVRVLNSSEDITDFMEGDIVVSFNTNPSLMPALIRCGGIVTDEGGIMCHAAIISRELKKPCITGTKIATKIFKDGDIVEVDADNGLVRKIDTL